MLLFFDPDKPGTTGETLSILTNSLVGIENKLYIILNKADQFRKIHDFARAYGSLCWNLSKVIHRKDLPRIFTMCLPPAYRSKSPPGVHLPQATNTDYDSEVETLGHALLDLETSREEVVQEVMNAPKRRVDNEITRLGDATHMLLMHCRVLDSLVAAYRSSLWKARAGNVTAAAAVTAVVAASVLIELPMQFSLAALGVGVVTYGAFSVWQSSSLKKEAARIAPIDNVESVYRRIHGRRISEQDEYISSLWLRVKDQIKVGVTAGDIQRMNRINSTDFANLENLIDMEIPNLRRKAAPAYSKFSEKSQNA